MGGLRNARDCEICGSPYRPTYKDQRTCGRECGLTLRGLAPRQPQPDKRDLDAPLTAERQWLKRRRYERNLAYMRTYVLNRYHNNPAVRQQMTDNARRSMAKRRGSTYTTHVSLDEIAARDGNRCHICGKKVKERDRSLDHLVPVSHGGAHIDTNVALAHRSCNSRRGAGRITAQLLLV